MTFKPEMISLGMNLGIASYYTPKDPWKALYWFTAAAMSIALLKMKGS